MERAGLVLSGYGSVRAALDGKLAELSGYVQLPSAERVAEVMEQVTILAQADQDALQAEQRFQLVRQINEAIRRLNDGTYGVCVECNEPISSKRLAALPWAAMCITCQEAADKAEREQ